MPTTSNIWSSVEVTCSIGKLGICIEKLNLRVVPFSVQKGVGSGLPFGLLGILDSFVCAQDYNLRLNNWIISPIWIQ